MKFKKIFQNFGKNFYQSQFRISGRIFMLCTPIFLLQKIQKQQVDCFWPFDTTTIINKIKDRVFQKQYQSNQPIEDRVLIEELENIPGFVTAVLDGHGEYVKKHIMKFINKNLNEIQKDLSDENIEQALKKSFKEMEEKYINNIRYSYENGFGKVANVGSCALLALIIDNRIFVANLGDSKGVILSKKNNETKIKDVNEILNADEQQEQERLKKQFKENDIIYCKHQNKACYVKGRIQPTYVFGDLHLKHEEFNNPQNLPRSAGYRNRLQNFKGNYLSAIPKIQKFVITEEDKLLILATDGLWDCIDNNMVVELSQKLSGQKLINNLIKKAIDFSAKKHKMNVQQLEALGTKKRSVIDDISIVLVDLKDGTLSYPRQKSTPEIKQTLLKAQEIFDIAIVGGSDRPKQLEQLGDLVEIFDWAFSENGTKSFDNNGKVFHEMSINKKLGEQLYQELVDFCLLEVSKIKLPFKRGNFIEYRSGMVNISPVGRSVNLEERKIFNELNLKENYLNNLANKIRDQFGDKGIFVGVGGQISIDVFPIGWDKTYCLQFISDKYDEIHFFGDRTYKGGNDYEIFSHERTIGYTIKDGPPQTIEEVEKLLLKYGNQKKLEQFIQRIIYMNNLFQINKINIMQNQECFICCEPEKIKTIGDCNHQLVCLSCSYKMRVKNRDIKCLQCNRECPEVIVTNNPKLIFNQNLCTENNHFNNNFYCVDPKMMEACQKLLEIQCQIVKCDKVFQRDEIEQYQQHLENDHNRYLCDLCLDKGLLLLKEQKIFRHGEYMNHKKYGDQDQEGNLILKHPYCEFCKQYFFDEDDFLIHTKLQHQKCHLCKDDKYRYLIYNNIQTLQKHFKLSHFACEVSSCLDKFKVWSTKAGLMKHLKNTHQQKITQSMDWYDNSNNVLKDQEGLDIQKELISHSKLQDKKARGDLDFQNFKKKLNYIEIMDLLGSQFKTLEQELILINSSEDQFDDFVHREMPLTIENIAFDRIQFQNVNKEVFLEMINDLINSYKLNLIKKTISEYIKNKIDEDVLFQNFQKAFGKYLVYKYFYVFTQSMIESNFYDRLSFQMNRRVQMLSFSKQNLLSSSISWKILFSRVIKSIKEVILKKIINKEIDLNKIYKIQSGRLFQLFGSIKNMNLNDFTKLNYLKMFMLKTDSFQIIKRIFTCQIDHVDKNLNKLFIIDLLVSFLYFNYSYLIFEHEPIIQCPTNVNQNLIKIFMRHFPHLSEELDFSIQSEPEDNDNSSKEVKNYKNYQFNLEVFRDHKLLQQVNIFEKGGEIFQSKNLTDEQEFPTLEQDDSNTIKRGFKKQQQQYYQQQELKMNTDDFPELQDNQEKCLLNFNQSKKNLKKQMLDKKYKLDQQQKPKESSKKQKLEIWSQNNNNNHKQNYPVQQVIKNYEQDLNSFPLIDKKSSFQPRNVQQKDFFGKIDFPQPKKQSKNESEQFPTLGNEQTGQNLFDRMNSTKGKFKKNKKSNLDQKFAKNFNQNVYKEKQKEYSKLQEKFNYQEDQDYSDEKEFYEKQPRVHTLKYVSQQKQPEFSEKQIQNEFPELEQKQQQQNQDLFSRMDKKKKTTKMEILEQRLQVKHEDTDLNIVPKKGKKKKKKTIQI